MFSVRLWQDACDRTLVPTEGSQLNISGTMRDRALVYLDGRLMETVYNNRLLPFVVVMSLYHRLTASRVATSSSTMSTLELVVEIRKRTGATQFTNIFFNFWENMRDFNFWKNIFWYSEKK